MRRGYIKHDLKGKTFGRLTVLSLGPRSGFSQQWLCACSCGNTKIIRASRLINGRTVSCGCYGAEVRRKKATKHGQSSSPIYGVWRGMLSRCYDPEDSHYVHYGERGISVCDEWRNDVNAFILWAQANGYARGLTIDRRDNDKCYTPENCRWATVEQQNRNTRQNRIITFDGRRKCVVEWAEITGLDPKTLYSRLDAGWSDERTITTPRRSWGKQYRRGA